MLFILFSCRLQLATSPFRTQLEQVSDALSGVSPDLMRQIGPLINQLSPIYMDVAQGTAEFTPAPAETRKLIRSYYGETSSASMPAALGPGKPAQAFLDHGNTASCQHFSCQHSTMLAAEGCYR